MGYLSGTGMRDTETRPPTRQQVLTACRYLTIGTRSCNILRPRARALARVYVCVCVGGGMCTCVRMCVICVCVCLSVCVRVCVFVCASACVCECTSVCAHCVCVCANVYIYSVLIRRVCYFAWVYRVSDNLHFRKKKVQLGSEHCPKNPRTRGKSQHTVTGCYRQR